MGKFCNIRIIEIPDNHVYKVVSAFLAEFFGTAFFVGIGCMGITYTDENYYLAGFSFGLVLMVVVEAFRYISGGVFNPALGWCALICEKINCGTWFCYTIAQCIGAICGYCTLMSLLPQNISLYHSCFAICITVPNENISTVIAFAVEFFFTWVLAWVQCSQWCSVNSSRNDSISVKIGFIFGFLYCVSAYYTGGSMNPARSFAAALYNKCWKNHWIYWAGPIGGSITSSIIYKISYNLSCTTNYLKLQNVPKI